jgi:hypothetical protein
MYYYLPDEFTHIIATEIEKPFFDDANADADNTPYNEWVEKMRKGKDCKKISTSRKLEAQFASPKYNGDYPELEEGTDFISGGDFAMTLQEYSDLEINED